MEWDEEFVAFVRAHSDALFRSACLLTSDSAAAADLVQETLTRLYPKWHMVAAASVPVAYVRGALAKQYLSQSRRRSSRELVMADVPDSPAQAGRDPDARIMLAVPLRALSPRQRTAIVLRYFEDLDDRAAAQAMRCPVATFRSHVRRGLSALRAALFTDSDTAATPADQRSA